MKNIMEELPRSTEMVPIYRELQGSEADAEILERYKVMIDYFTRHQERAVTGKNALILNHIYYSDRVLMKNEQLREKLRQILTLPITSEATQ